MADYPIGGDPTTGDPRRGGSGGVERADPGTRRTRTFPDGHGGGSSPNGPANGPPLGGGGGGEPPPTPIQPPSNPSSKPANQEARSRTLTFGGVGQCIPALFGRVQVGADVIFARTVGNLCYIAAVIGRGPVNSITSIRIGGKSMTDLGLNENVSFFVHLGGADQTLDPLIASIEDEWLFALPGIAYITFRLNISNANAANVDPKEILVVCEGLLVRDYNQDPTLVTRYFTDNPAWVMADILTARRYGLGEKDGNLDWSASWKDAADICDVAVSGSVEVPVTAPTIALAQGAVSGLTKFGTYQWAITFEDTAGKESLSGPATGIETPPFQPTWATLTDLPIGGAGIVARRIYRTKADGLTPMRLVKRIANNTTVSTVDNLYDFQLGATINDLETAKQFRLAVALNEPQTAEQWIQQLRGQFQSYLAFNNGQYQLFIDSDSGIGSLVFDETTITGIPQISSNGLEEIPTRVTVGYTDQQNDFKQDSAQDEDPNLIATVSATLRVEKRELKFSYYGIPSYDQAFRVAHWLLKRGQLDKTLSWRTNQLGTRPIPGSVVRVRFPMLQLWDQSDNSIGQPTVVTQCGPAEDSLGWQFHGEFYDPTIYDTTYRNPLDPTGGGDTGEPPPPPPTGSEMALRLQWWNSHTDFPGAGG